LSISAQISGNSCTWENTLVNLAAGHE